MARLYGFADQSRQRLNDAEAEVIRQVAARIFGGMNRKSTVAWMAQAGHRTTQGGLWSNWPLTRLLTNPAIAGLRLDPGSGELVATGGPSPLTPEEFHRLQPILAAATGARAGAAHDRDYWASEVLECGLSGDSMTGSPNANGTPSYRCGTCRRVQIVAEPLEACLANILLAQLAHPEAMAQLQQARERAQALAASLREQEQALVRSRAELATALAEQEVTLGGFKDAERALSGKLANVRQRLRYLGPTAALDLDLGEEPDLDAWWSRAAPATRKGVARLVFERIVVHPATTRTPFPDETDIRDRLDVVFCTG